MCMFNLLKIKTNGSHDVLVRWQALIDEVGVIDDVATEDKASSDCEDNIHGATKRNEQTNEACHTWE